MHIAVPVYNTAAQRKQAHTVSKKCGYFHALAPRLYIVRMRT